MNLKDDELETVARIVNQEIKDYPEVLKEVGVVTKNDFNRLTQKDVVFWDDDIVRVPGKSTIKLWAKDKFRPYFDKVVKSRIGDSSLLYHSLKYEYALSIITNKKIQLSALSYLWSNDPAEYTEFNNRYARSLIQNTAQLEQDKDKIFIFCFTDNCDNERYWNLYGDKENGVCLGFRFTKFTDDINLKDGFMLRNVHYDNGYDFDFLNDIQAKLMKELGRKLYSDGLGTLSKFYKRSKYAWEREVRLCFDYDILEYIKDHFAKKGERIPEGMDLSVRYPIQFDPAVQRHFITLDLHNEFFTLEIDEVICGKDINDSQFNEIQRIVSKNVKVTRRK